MTPVRPDSASVSRFRLDLSGFRLDMSRFCPGDTAESDVRLGNRFILPFETQINEMDDQTPAVQETGRFTERRRPNR